MAQKPLHLRLDCSTATEATESVCDTAGVKYRKPLVGLLHVWYIFSVFVQSFLFEIVIILFKKAEGQTFVSNFFEIPNFSLTTQFCSSKQVN